MGQKGLVEPKSADTSQRLREPQSTSELGMDADKGKCQSNAQRALALNVRRQGMERHDEAWQGGARCVGAVDRRSMFQVRRYTELFRSWLHVSEKYFVWPTLR